MAVYILGLAIILITALYIVYPFLSLRGRLPARGSDDESELLQRRELLYREIAELDFDQRLGRLDEEDYRDQREEYLEEAATVLKALDERSGFDQARDGESALPSIDSEIEREVRRLREQARR